MQYPPDMDPLIVPLCDAINDLPCTQTIFSCQGHKVTDKEYIEQFGITEHTPYVMLITYSIEVANLLIEAFCPVRQMLKRVHKDKIGDWNGDIWKVHVDFHDIEMEDEEPQPLNALCLSFNRPTWVSDKEAIEAFAHKIWRINKLRCYYDI